MTTDRPATPHNLAEVVQEITVLLAGVQDPNVQMGPETDGYGKCVEAMWRTGYLAMEFVAHELGVTGFQHGFATMKLLGALSHYEGPFMVSDVANALYPQYDLEARLRDYLASDDIRTWLADQAQEKLEKDAAQDEWAHPNVRAHWRKLVQERPA